MIKKTLFSRFTQLTVQRDLRLLDNFYIAKLYKTLKYEKV